MLLMSSISTSFSFKAKHHYIYTCSNVESIKLIRLLTQIKCDMGDLALSSIT